MPTDLDRCNQLIIKGIIKRSNLNENGRSDTSCYNLSLHVILGDYPSWEYFGERFGGLFGSNPFFYGKTRFLNPAEKVDIKDLG